MSAVEPESRGGRVTEEFPGSPKIGILVVAYNAESTLAKVLDRVPDDFWPRISRIFVCDDASADSTFLVGLGYQQQHSDLPLKIMRHPENLGYGGNQKAGYRMAIDEGLDIIVMLHGDGQYAPECLPEIVGPLERGEADCVMGSRMMVAGDARSGGMPLYKYLGNRILTEFENRVLGTELTEFHSGYRAYRVDALASIPFERNADGFHFDTQIIIQLVDAGKKILEVPIPTFYGDEICYVNGIRYARDVSTDVVRYRLGKLGFISGEYGGVDEDRFDARDPDASHSTILRWVRHIRSGRVLTLGKPTAAFVESLRAAGHIVEVIDPEQVDAGLLDSGPSTNLYDTIIALDVLERVRNPEAVLTRCREILAHDGQLAVAVPNFGHWYVRLRTLLGLFDYDQRGILDRSHVRFFTRRGLLHRLRMAGFDVVSQDATGLPLDIFADQNGAAKSILRSLDQIAATARPTLFGYQLLALCQRSHSFDAARPKRGAPNY